MGFVGKGRGELVGVGGAVEDWMGRLDEELGVRARRVKKDVCGGQDWGC
jgi:hypothetical protein